MTATYAPIARPPNTAIAWASKDSLYVEIPCRDGPPLVCRYRKSIEGLAAALNVLVEHDEQVHRTIQTSHPKITKVPPSPKVAWATEEQRARARDILKRLKIT